MRGSRKRLVALRMIRVIWLTFGDRVPALGLMRYGRGAEEARATPTPMTAEGMNVPVAYLGPTNAGSCLAPDSADSRRLAARRPALLVSRTTSAYAARSGPGEASAPPRRRLNQKTPRHRRPRRRSGSIVGAPLAFGLCESGDYAAGGIARAAQPHSPPRHDWWPARTHATAMNSAAGGSGPPSPASAGDG